MKTYRFLGTEAIIGGAQPSSVNRYGQTVQLADENLEPALRSGAPLLPDDRFAAHGITDAELTKHFSTELHEEAPKEFVSKRDAAWEDMHRFRAEVLCPEIHKDGEV